MAVTILHKRNAAPGAVPTIAALAAGEFAVNTADGDVFIRILTNPAGANNAGNQQILSVRRPLYADGGEITIPGPAFNLNVEGYQWTPSTLNIYSNILDAYSEYEWQQNDGTGWVSAGNLTDFFQITPDQPYGPMSFRVRVKINGVWTDWSVQSLGVTWQPYGTIQSEGCDLAVEYNCCTGYADGAGGSFSVCGGPNSYAFAPQAWGISNQNFGVVGAPSSSGAQLVWPPISVNEYGQSFWGGTADTRRYIISTSASAQEYIVPWTVTTYFVPLPAGTTNEVSISAESAGGRTYSNVVLSITTPPVITAPGAPTSVAGTAGNGQAALTWIAPASNGGAAITDYTVQYSTNSGSTWTTFSDGTSTATSAAVTGLTNGTAYTFRVAAVNIAGTGAYSAAASSVTPVTTPGAPAALSAIAGNAQVALSWIAPASNGGAAITDYAVQYSSDSGSTWTTFADGTSTATSATVTGLTNGTTYTFRVAALNSVGTGSYSSASSSVTPAIPGPSLTKLSNGTVATFTGSGTVADPFVAASYMAVFTQAARFQINGSGTVYMKYNATGDEDGYFAGTWWRDDGSRYIKEFFGPALAGTDKVLSQSMADGTQFRISIDVAGSCTNVRIWVQ